MPAFIHVYMYICMYMCTRAPRVKILRYNRTCFLLSIEIVKARLLTREIPCYNSAGRKRARRYRYIGKKTNDRKFNFTRRTRGCAVRSTLCRELIDDAFTDRKESYTRAGVVFTLVVLVWCLLVGFVERTINFISRSCVPRNADIARRTKTRAHAHTSSPLLPFVCRVRSRSSLVRNRSEKGQRFGISLVKLFSCLKSSLQ